MRITYNFSKAEYSYYNEENEDAMLFGTIFDEDEAVIMSPFIEQGDAYATYDVSHWTIMDVIHFDTLEEEDKIGLLEGLTEITV